LQNKTSSNQCNQSIKNVNVNKAKLNQKLKGIKKKWNRIEMVLNH